MRFENHIVRRLLTDPNLWVEMVITQAESQGVVVNNLVDYLDTDEGANLRGMYHMLDVKDNKTYLVTKSVTDKLDLLDTKKCIDIEGWKLFKSLPDFKKTFILPDGNSCLRVFKHNGVISFAHITFKFHPPEKRTPVDDGELYWILLYVDLDNNKLAEHWLSADGKRIAPFLYALMCYVELCDNEIIVVQPNGKHGTKKSGKLINTLPFPITIINNTWNTTKVLSGTIPVCGHAQIYWTGPGRTMPKLQFKEPFTKEGYTRRSGKELATTKN
jgi:hypothetical protein